MEVTSILEELRGLLDTESENENRKMTPLSDEGLLRRRNEVKEKLDSLTSLVSIVGPVARKEAIELKPFQLIYLAWQDAIFIPEKDKEDEEEEQDENEEEVTVEALREVTVGAMDDFESLRILREAALRALNSLAPGYPDGVDPEVVADMVLTVLKPEVPDGDVGARIPESMRVEALKAVKNACIHCERNREVFANFTNEVGEEGVEDSFIPAFCDTIKHDASHLIMRTWCESLCALVLNDDRRVVPNRAEDRKRLITQNGGLSSLIGLMPKLTDPHLLNPIVIAITMMASSKEQCDLLLASGALGTGSGLELILQNFTGEERDRLVLNAILCVRNLSLGLTFQRALENSYVVRNMVAAAHRMKGRFSHVEVIMSSLGHVTINSPTAVTQFLAGGGVPTTLDIMDSYKDNVTLLKSCCLILDNVIANGGSMGEKSLGNDGEALLKDLIRIHPDLIQGFSKATQRDLGLLNL